MGFFLAPLNLKEMLQVYPSEFSDIACVDPSQFNNNVQVVCSHLNIMAKVDPIQLHNIVSVDPTHLKTLPRSDTGFRASLVDSQPHILLIIYAGRISIFCDSMSFQTYVEEKFGMSIVE